MAYVRQHSFLSHVKLLEAIQGCRGGRSAANPDSFHLFAPPCITFIPKVALWTKVAAVALTLTSLFQKAGRKRMERKRKFLLISHGAVCNYMIKMSFKKRKELVLFLFGDPVFV